ncbi:hypothetical protein CAP48_00305 [Advenella sp. S44]|nr:hypothetical protein CAP48_00305 [Advenella sp. S44]
MVMGMNRLFKLLFTSVALVLSNNHALAQEKPVLKTPVMAIVPFSPGALIDIIARIYSETLSKQIGQPVVVENRPGAGGMVGTQRLLSEDVARNTLLFVSSSYAVNPSVQEKLPFDTLRDLSGVASIAYSPTLVVVNPKSPYKTLQDLIAAAKKKDAYLTYGSAGVNSATDLVGRYFNQEAGIQLEHIPYKGVQEGVAEVVAGRIDVSFAPIALAMPYIKDGRLKAIGITSEHRSDILPDVPTVSEQGVADFDYAIWYGVIMNAKTPDPMKAYMAEQISAVNSNPDVKRKLEQQGLISRTVSLDEFDAYIKQEIEKFRKILKPTH